MEYASSFLAAVFRLMMSNSWLCDQIDRITRKGLARRIGMDQVDAQQTYATGRDFLMKQDRRQMINDAMPGPWRKRHRGVDHNETKSQYIRLSE